MASSLELLLKSQTQNYPRSQNSKLFLNSKLILLPEKIELKTQNNYYAAGTTTADFGLFS